VQFLAETRDAEAVRATTTIDAGEKLPSDW